jgi:hypothetical protein
MSAETLWYVQTVLLVLSGLAATVPPARPGVLRYNLPLAGLAGGCVVPEQHGRCLVASHLLHARDVYARTQERRGTILPQPVEFAVMRKSGSPDDLGPRRLWVRRSVLRPAGE